MVRAKTILTIGGLQSTTDEAQIRGALRLTGSSGPDPTPTPPKKPASGGGGEGDVTPPTTPKTDATLTRQRAQRLASIRRAAGTSGKDLGFATEFGLLKQFGERAEKGELTQKEIKTLQEEGIVRTPSSAFLPGGRVNVIPKKDLPRETTSPTQPRPQPLPKDILIQKGTGFFKTEKDFSFIDQDEREVKQTKIAKPPPASFVQDEKIVSRTTAPGTATFDPRTNVSVSEPFFEKRIVDEEGGVPTTKLFFVDPARNITRSLTALEEKETRPLFEKEVISQKKLGLTKISLDKVLRAIEVVDTGLKESITRPLLKDTEKAAELALSFDKATPTSAIINLASERGIRVAQNIPFITPGVKSGFKEFTVGAVEGALVDIREKPLKNIGLVAAGFGVGAGIKGFTAGARATGGLVSPAVATQSEFAAKGLILAGGVGVTGLFAEKAIIDITSSGSFREAGGKVGIISKDLTLLGLGGRAGEKAFTKAQDFLATRGATEVPFGDITVTERFAASPRGTTAKQLRTQFKEQRIVTKGGVDKLIKLPGEEKVFFQEPSVARIPGSTIKELAGEDFSTLLQTRKGIKGVKSFSASTGIRDKEFAALLGKSREPGFFSAPHLSKEFLKLKAPAPKFFGLDGGGTTKPTAFRLVFKDIARVPDELLSPRFTEFKAGKIKGFKGFTTPAEAKIISFRASTQDPTKALISTRFELQGGEIEAIGRAGAVFKRIPGAPRLFTRGPSGKVVPIEFVKPTGRVVIPKDLVVRERPTALIKTKKGILTTFSPEEQAFVLPGGGRDLGESLTKSLGREIFEETGLKIISSKPVGTIKGPIKRFGSKRPFTFVQEDFKVFTAATTGVPKASGEITKLGFIRRGSRLKLSKTTKDILKLAGEDIGLSKSIRSPKVKSARSPIFISKKDLLPGELTGSDIARLSSDFISSSRRGIVTPSRVGLGSLLSRRKTKERKVSRRIIAPVTTSDFKPPVDIERSIIPTSLEKVIAPKRTQRIPERVRQIRASQSRPPEIIRRRKIIPKVTDIPKSSFSLKGKVPKKKQRLKPEPPLTLAEGFTARAIGLAPERLTTKQARARALKPEGLGLSRAPIIIDIDKKPRRKVKKKTKGRKKR